MLLENWPYNPSCRDRAGVSCINSSHQVGGQAYGQRLQRTADGYAPPASRERAKRASRACWNPCTQLELDIPMVNSGDLGSSSSTRDHQGTCFIVSCFRRLPQYIPYALPLKEISSVGIFSSIILLSLGDNHKLFSQPLCHLHRYLCVHCCTSLGTVLG